MIVGLLVYAALRVAGKFPHSGENFKSNYLQWIPATSSTPKIRKEMRQVKCLRTHVTRIRLKSKTLYFCQPHRALSEWLLFCHFSILISSPNASYIFVPNLKWINRTKLDAAQTRQRPTNEQTTATHIEDTHTHFNERRIEQILWTDSILLSRICYIPLRQSHFLDCSNSFLRLSLCDQCFRALSFIRNTHKRSRAIFEFGQQAPNWKWKFCFDATRTQCPNVLRALSLDKSSRLCRATHIDSVASGKFGSLLGRLMGNVSNDNTKYTIWRLLVNGMAEADAWKTLLLVSHLMSHKLYRYWVH